MKKYVFIISFLVLFFSCTKNDSTTIVLIGPEDYIPEITSIIPNSLIQNMGGIYYGNVPPKIEGEFVASPYIISKSNVPTDVIGTIRDDRFIKFSNQHNGICSYITKQYSETASCDTVYIMGKGSNFTVYFIEHRTDKTNGTSAKTAVIITGQITTAGINSFKYGWMLLDKKDPNSIMLPINSIRIFTDSDGVATRHEWN